MALTRLLEARITDPTTESVVKSHAVTLKEIMAAPSLEIRVIGPITIPDGDPGIQIPHGLGRRPLAFFLSPPDGAITAGVVQDYGASTPAGTTNDQTKYISLRAVGFGRAITVMVMVL